jgi:tetratricopeptide (TPR) repeat protein
MQRLGGLTFATFHNDNRLPVKKGTRHCAGALMQPWRPFLARRCASPPCRPNRLGVRFFDIPADTKGRPLIGAAKYRVILCAVAALLVAIAVQPSAADDRSECQIWLSNEAIAACSRLLALNPNDADAYNGRGNAYNGEGHYDRAIADFDQAIRLDPKNANSYNDRGNSYSVKRDYDQAIADYDQAIRLNPKFAAAYCNRGQAYEAKNDPDHAIADFEQALKLDPSLADARQGRERAQVLLAKRSNPGTQTNTPAR